MFSQLRASTSGQISEKELDIALSVPYISKQLKLSDLLSKVISGIS